MFWGLIMEPQRRYSQVIKKSFHISMAALDISTADDEPAQVMCGFEGRNYLLCTLKKPEVVQVQLDLNFEKGSEVSFATNGRCIVHLTGYLNDDVIPSFDEDDDLEGEEEEDSDVEVVSEDSKKRHKVKSLNGPPAKKVKAEDSGIISSTQLLKSSEDDEDSDDSDDSDVDMSTLLLKDSDDSEEEDDEEEEEEEVEEEGDSGEELGEEQDEEQDEEEDYEEEDDDDLSSMSDDEVFQNQLGKSKPKLNGEAKKKDQSPNKLKVKEEKTPSKQKDKQIAKTPKSETKNKEKGNKSLNIEAKSPKESKTPGKEQKKQKEGKGKEQGKTPLKEQGKTPVKEQGKTPKDQGKTPVKEQGKTGKEQGKSPKKKVLQGGVIVEEIREGSGETAKSGRMVHVHYEGRFKDSNKMFDSATKGPGFGFRLGKGEVIKGWDIGVAGMKLGGKRRIICPAPMAYGNKGSPPEIPPNSTLVFEVELKKVS